MDALAYIERPRIQRLFVVHGDEDFLRRLVIQAIRHAVLGEGGGEDGLSFSVHSGETATFAAVMDELQTVPFFGERRLVVVDDADPFVTEHRGALEKAIGRLPSSGVLVLSVKTWPSTTRLAKMVDAAGTIACKAPHPNQLPAWCVKEAARQQKQLTRPAADLLVDLVGPEMGLLDQELLKLAIYVGAKERIDVEDVDKLVGRSREEKTWIIFEAICAGDPAQALAILDQLFDQGEDFFRLLGAFSKHMRQLTQAYRLTLQGRPLAMALQEVGVPPYDIRKSDQQIKHIGRRRLDQLYDWLLEIDSGAKGGSQLPKRTLLERLVVRLVTSPGATSTPAVRPAISAR
jgi:DNA polymerase III subunit delta